MYALYTSPELSSAAFRQQQSPDEGATEGATDKPGRFVDVETNHDPTKIPLEVRNEVKRRVERRVREIEAAVEALEERATAE